MTVRGAAIAAGLHAGVWPNLESIQGLEADVYEAKTNDSGECGEREREREIEGERGTTIMLT